jgi:hypothetical protein
MSITAVLLPSVTYLLIFPHNKASFYLRNNEPDHISDVLNGLDGEVTNYLRVDCIDC